MGGFGMGELCEACVRLGGEGDGMCFIGFKQRGE